MFLCPASWQASVTDVLSVQFVYLIHDLMLASERNISNGDQDRMAVTGPKMSRLCWTDQENLLINCVLNPFGFVIDRIILAVFSNFYLHHGYSDQPTDLPEFELLPRDTTPECFKNYVNRFNNMFTSMNITRPKRKWYNYTMLGRILTISWNSYRTRTDQTKWRIQNCHQNAFWLLRTSEVCWSPRLRTFLSEKAKLRRKHDRVLYTSADAATQMRVRWYRVGNQTANNSRHFISKAIEQNLDLEKLLKTARSDRSFNGDEQTSEIKNQQSHAVGFGRNRGSDDAAGGEF